MVEPLPSKQMTRVRSPSAAPVSVVWRTWVRWDMGAVDTGVMDTGAVDMGPNKTVPGDDIGLPMEFRTLGRTGIKVSPLCLGADDVR